MREMVLENAHRSSDWPKFCGGTSEAFFQASNVAKRRHGSIGWMDGSGEMAHGCRAPTSWGTLGGAVGTLAWKVGKVGQLRL